MCLLNFDNKYGNTDVADREWVVPHLHHPELNFWYTIRNLFFAKFMYKFTNFLQIPK